MIIQSSNKPIILKVNDDLTSLKMRATLWKLGNKAKEWLNEDAIYRESNIIELPLQQEETATFSTGEYTLEIKWLNEAGLVLFSKQIPIKVVNRFDKEVMEND